MKIVTPNQIIVKHDIYRYKKNKLASMLALGGLVLNCLFFCFLYGMVTVRNSSTGELTWFVKLIVGGSVILNLLILLFGFFGSEGIKVYNKKFSILLIALAVVQFARIFIYPLYILRENIYYLNGNVPYHYFGNQFASATPIFVIMVIYLLGSAACFASSAIIGYIRATSLEKHVKAVEAGEIDMDKTLESMDNEDAQKAQEVTAKEVPNA